MMLICSLTSYIGIDVFHFAPREIITNTMAHVELQTLYTLIPMDTMTTILMHFGYIFVNEKFCNFD